MRYRKILSALIIAFALCCLIFTLRAEAQNLTPQPHEAMAPYWTAEPGWSTELQLRNNLAQSPLTVTPALRLHDGREIKLAPVTIAPATVVSVDVNQQLLQVAPDLTNRPGAYGSVGLQYTSITPGNLYAVAMVRMIAQPIGYHIDAFPVSKNPAAGSREGIWWQPHPGISDFLVISNGAGKNVNGKLSLYDAVGREWSTTVQLGAHQSARLVVSDLVRSAGLQGSYGGIKFTVPEAAVAVDSVHLLFDPTAGFSAMMKMFDRDPAAKLEERTWAGNQQYTQWAPMLALQTPDPVIGLPLDTILEPVVFLRNTTNKTITANMTLGWRGDSGAGKAAPNTMTLGPFATLRVDISSMQKKLGIPADAHWALVTLTTPASPDDLIAVAASYDLTGRYGAQTPFSDQLSGHWVGGLWQVDATHNTIAAITNGGNRATDALLTLYYGGGQQKYELQRTLAAGEQMWLNFADLIRNQQPDRNGKTLPINLTSGTYELRDLKPGRNYGGNLFEGKVIVDKTWGHLTYGCMTCCGYSGVSLDPGSFGLAVGFTSQPQPMADDGCSGAATPVDFPTNWWTGNSGIATYAQRVVTARAAGSTNNFAQGPLQFGPMDGGKRCPMRNPTASNMVNTFTPSQHTYPNAPLQNCRISQPFDAFVNQALTKKHAAQDVAHTAAGTVQVGEPVFAPEAGTIADFKIGQPSHLTSDSKTCAGQGFSANYVTIKDGTGNLTRLVHVTILANFMIIGTPVSGGKQVGTVDVSGCTTHAHVHMGRKLANGQVVNFTIPCDNTHFDDPSTFYDDSDGLLP